MPIIKKEKPRKLYPGPTGSIPARRRVNQDTKFVERLDNSMELGKMENANIIQEHQAAADALAAARAQAAAARAQAAAARAARQYEESIVPDLSDKTTIDQVVSIMGSSDPNEYVWYISTNQDGKYFKAGNYIKKHDFTQLGPEMLGLYLPREDYPTFYRYSEILVFYEFSNDKVFSDSDLVGKFFQTDKPSNNQLVTINTSTRTRDLNNKKEYVRTAKSTMREAIEKYLISKMKGPLQFKDAVRWDIINPPNQEKYTNFYEKIVPMVQRNLENNPNYKGSIRHAIDQLDSLEEKVKEMVSDFTLEKYMTGEYIDSIEGLLSPVVAAPVIQTAAPVIPTAAASAAPAAPPASVLGSFMPTVVTKIASAATSGVGYLGDVARSAASKLGNYGEQAISTGVNFGTTQFGLPIPQQPQGWRFERHVPPPSANPRMSTNYTAAETPYYNLIGRDYPAGQETWDKARQAVARQEDAANANKTSIFPFVDWPKFGGKKKSKRKQRKSQKQKKSRKQRR